MKFLKFFPIFLFFSFELFAYSDVAVNDRNYEWLERFALQGFLDYPFLSTRPQSREEMAKKVVRIIKKIRKKEIKFPENTELLEEGLNELIEEFGGELKSMGMDVAEKSKESFVSSQTQFVHSSYYYKFPNLYGWKIEKGLNLRSGLTFDYNVNQSLSLFLQPTFYLGGGKESLKLEKGYVALSFHNLRGIIGRDSLWWGPGYNGALLISNNAFPLDMIKIENKSPFYLPWKLSRIGPWKIVYFLTQLEKERHVPYAKLSGIRFSFMPLKNLELGANHTMMFGGRGGEKIDFISYLRQFLAFHSAGFATLPGSKSNHLISLDGTLYLPLRDELSFLGSGLKLYGEWGAEDERHRIPVDPGYIYGFYLINLFKNQGLDVRMERAWTHNVWYKHEMMYHTGYKYKGNFLGHHMGGDAKSFYLKLDKLYPDGVRFSLTYEREKRGLKIKKFPEERKKGTIEVGLRKNKSLEYFNSFSVEKIYNKENRKGKNQKNWVSLMGVKIKF